MHACVRKINLHDSLYNIINWMVLRVLQTLKVFICRKIVMSTIAKKASFIFICLKNLQKRFPFYYLHKFYQLLVRSQVSIAYSFKLALKILLLLKEK